MDRKKLVWIGFAVGSAIGSYIPSLWDDSLISISGILLGALGGIIGIYIGYKLGD